MMLSKPCIVEETENFAVVFKPPKMHSVPLKQKEGGNLLEWYADNQYKLMNYALMHRLDFETHGLVLFAKNIPSYKYFKDLQEKGEFIKEYSLVSDTCTCKLPGFPPSFAGNLNLADSKPSPEKPFVIESYFRPFGEGRKFVRPVTEEKKHRDVAKDKGGFYRTEITGVNGNALTVRIRRGFRHQIRCHLCWIGFPILNDPLYSTPPDDYSAVSLSGKTLALRAHTLFFNDPLTGEKREYSIEPLVSVQQI